MQDRGLSEFLSFSGRLQGDGGTAEVSFRARVNQSGEVEFDFGTIQVTHAIRFVSRSWDQPGPKPVYFSLIGNTEDDITLETSHLHFSTLNEQWSRDTGRQISPVGSSLRTVFRRKMAAPAAKPVLRMHLKGFRNFGPLRVRCPLGTIAMTGATPVPDPDIMTGIIEVVPDDAPADLFAWRSQADKLLEHVRRVMSLAAAAVLRVPIVEFYNGVECQVIALSQSPQSAGSMRTFRYLQQQPIFEAAVDSFFRPPIDAKNLSFAIEWFAMDTSYNEVRLVNAMTALENLLASNLDEPDVFLQPEEEFQTKTRPALKKVMRKCIAMWPPETRQELYGKLGELNRRALLRKLEILAERWSVPLDGIPEDRIKAAKNARDRIVHRGHYYDHEEAKRDDLWAHVTVVREIVVRFLLTAIGYRGPYVSYLGGPHDAQFPPGEG